MELKLCELNTVKRRAFEAYISEFHSTHFTFEKFRLQRKVNIYAYLFKNVEDINSNNANWLTASSEFSEVTFCSSGVFENLNPSIPHYIC